MHFSLFENEMSQLVLHFMWRAFKLLLLNCGHFKHIWHSVDSGERSEISMEMDLTMFTIATTAAACILFS